MSDHQGKAASGRPSSVGREPARLAALLRESLEPGVVAGIAVVGSEGGSGPSCPGAPAGVFRADPAVAWVPENLGQEPAFLIYSISKTVIATLVLLLAEEGRLGLDDLVSQWMPRIPRSGEMTLRQVLNHTAGLPDYGPLPAYQEAVRRSPGKPWSFDEFAAATWERGLSYAPGAGWGYSNPGFMVLKRTLEEASGTPFSDLFCQRLAQPLGLTRTRVAESPKHLRELVPAFSQDLDPDRKPIDVREAYHPGWVSHGVLVSTPTEVAGFLAALVGGRILSPSSLAQMAVGIEVPNAPPEYGRPMYGLGLMIDGKTPMGPLWGHNGAGPGYQASVFAAIAPDGHHRVACALVAAEAPDVAEKLVRQALAFGKEPLRGPSGEAEVGEGIYRFLAENAIGYERVDHPAVYTCEEAERLVPPLDGADTKNLFLRDAKGRRHFLVVVGAHKTVDLKALSSKLGVSNLGFASADRLRTHLRIEPGSVSVLAVINDQAGTVEVILDEDLWKAEVLLCHPLVNTSTLAVRRDDLRRILEITNHRYRVLAVPELARRTEQT